MSVDRKQTDNMTTQNRAKQFSATSFKAYSCTNGGFNRNSSKQKRAITKHLTSVFTPYNPSLSFTFPSTSHKSGWL